MKTRITRNIFLEGTRLDAFWYGIMIGMLALVAAASVTFIIAMWLFK